MYVESKFFGMITDQEPGTRWGYERTCDGFRLTILGRSLVVDWGRRSLGSVRFELRIWRFGMTLHGTPDPVPSLSSKETA